MTTTTVHCSGCIHRPHAGDCAVILDTPSGPCPCVIRTIPADHLIAQVLVQTEEIRGIALANAAATDSLATKLDAVSSSQAKLADDHKEEMEILMNNGSRIEQLESQVDDLNAEIRLLKSKGVRPLRARVERVEKHLGLAPMPGDGSENM